jgi:hypothetical protein
LSSPTNVSGAKDQAQEKAQEAAGQARDRVRDQIDQRSTQAGEQVQTSASDIRSVAQQLREQGKEQPAKLAEQAADRAERLGGYLTGADADQLLRDLEDFGRRQPIAVVLGGLALGFAASRLLKASAQNRSSEAQQPHLPVTRTETTPTPGTPPPTDPVGGRFDRPAYVPTSAGGVA